MAGEPVDLLVNGTAIARGEVVVIDEQFGLRVTEMLGDLSASEPVDGLPTVPPLRSRSRPPRAKPCQIRRTRASLSSSPRRRALRPADRPGPRDHPLRRAPIGRVARRLGQGRDQPSGQIIPVYDLAARLGVPSRLTQHAKIVIVDAGAETAGVIVDGVEEVLTVDADQLQAAPGTDPSVIERSPRWATV